MNFTLIEKKQEAKDVTTFIFEPAEPLTWKAGQYLHYVLHHRPTDDRGSDRWFTVSSAPYTKRPSITTRFTAEKGSSFKAALEKLAVGETIEIATVEGDFTVEDPSLEYVFIAGGIGITPFHSILDEANHGGIKLTVTLLYSNRSSDIAFKRELDAFAAVNPNLRIVYVTDPERINEDTIKKYVPDIQKPLFYISGPKPMVESLAAVIEGLGVAKEHIKLDDFPGYAE